MVPDNLLIFLENMMRAIRETSSASHFQAFAMNRKGSSTRTNKISCISLLQGNDWYKGRPAPKRWPVLSNYFPLKFRIRTG
jgi:hypothetical protein